VGFWFFGWFFFWGGWVWGFCFVFVVLFFGVWWWCWCFFFFVWFLGVFLVLLGGFVLCSLPMSSFRRLRPRNFPFLHYLCTFGIPLDVRSSFILPHQFSPPFAPSSLNQVLPHWCVLTLPSLRTPASPSCQLSVCFMNRYKARPLKTVFPPSLFLSLYTVSFRFWWSPDFWPRPPDP